MTEPSRWSPAELLQQSGAYWSTCALHAGVKLDLFTHLAVEALSADELAARLGANQRSLSMLLDALAALELLRKEGERYRGTPIANAYLNREDPGYLGHIIRHHHHLMESWAHLDRAVMAGGPLRERSSHGEEEWRESFLMGMFNLAMQMAPRIVPQIDLAGRRRLLDLGGGPGTYASHFCLENPGLEATIYDLPTTRRFAEETVARFGLSERIRFEAGDFIAEGIEGSYDAIWLSHILHGESPQGCGVLIDKAVAALEPGGLVLVHEFILDDAKDGPVFPALFSLNMLLGTPGGQAYSRQEIFDMLASAGVGDLHRLDLDLPNGAGIIAGTLPK